MSEKRRDSKGRLLRTEESQRADGKYEYKYVDATKGMISEDAIGKMKD